MKKITKSVSIILVLIMVFSMMPQMTPIAYAAGDSTTIDVSDTINMPSSVSYGGGTRGYRS